jgi:hypothetical protein
MAIGTFSLLILVPLMIGCALLSGSLAHKKGYSYPLFAFLGLFFTVFTLIVVLAMPAKESAKPA